jgi:hypothetical protein
VGRADKETMSKRRTEPRLLCADLVEVRWVDKAGQPQVEVMNLEDISASGACLQSEHPMPKDTKIQIRYQNGELTAIVQYCNYQQIGYFLGVEFTEGSKWPSNHFQPKHLFDPMEMVYRAFHRDRKRTVH